jgi:ribonuclease HI
MDGRTNAAAHKIKSSMYNYTMAKRKYYVVWKGRKAGILNSWEECSAAVSGYAGARYKSFDSLPAAQAAFRSGYEASKGKPSGHQQWLFAPSKPVLPSISVDAACSGSPGPVEYRGVETETGRQIFRAGPYPDGTNNVGEFLAVVRALDWLTKHGHDWPIYSDSENAIAWVRAGKCNTKLARTRKNAMLFELIGRAEEHLRSSRASPAGRAKILKWDTRVWGENPADFGRK